MVEWDTAPEDHGLFYEGRINVVAFGRIFNAADLGYFDLWEEPLSHRGGTYGRAALNAERNCLVGLGYVNRMRVQDGRREEYVAQLFRTHRCIFFD